MIKALAAIGLLVLLIYSAGVGELVTVLRSIDMLSLFYLLLLSVVMIWASSAKWQMFVRAMGYEVSVVELMRLYTISYFFNTFTPASVGGDVMRSVHLGGKLSSQRDAFIATFLERFTGLLAMAILGTIFVIIGSGVTAGLELAILLVAAGTGVIALPCFSRTLARPFFACAGWFLERLSPAKHRPRAMRYLLKIEEGMSAAHDDRLLLLKGLLWSLSFHALTVLNTYLAARAVGWEHPSFAGLFVVVPLVLLVSMVPLTPNGIGIQEGAFVFLLERIGATRAEGLGTALILRAKVILLALVGWAMWSLSSHRSGQADSDSSAAQSAG